MRLLRTRITADGLDLSAWLDLPSDDGLHPAVLLIHGSGPTNLEEENRYLEIRKAFTGIGIACLQWDKPGCGSSAGLRRELQSHMSRAQEVRAALDWIGNRKDLDAGRVALWGISEGAWIAAMTTHGEDEIGCLILVSTPSSGLRYAAEYIARANLSLEGNKAGEIEIFLDDIRECFRLVAEGAPYESFLSASTRLRANEFFQMTG